MAASLGDFTNKDSWTQLQNASTIQVGNQIIAKSNNGDITSIDYVTPVTAKNGSTIMSKVENSAFGNWQLTNTISDTTTSGINTLGKGLGSGTSTILDGAGRVGNAIDTGSKKIEGYLAPVTETLEKISGIGKSFDDIIKNTFLGQIFKIKGSEILCALFCIIVSLLSCKERQALYQAVMDTKNAMNSVNSVASGVSSMTLGGSSNVEVPVFNNQTLADNVKNLFSKNKIDTAKQFGIPSNTQTKKAPVTFALPPGVADIVQKITMILSVIAKGQITIPVGINGNIWDIAQAILYVLQSQAVQMADEFMTKVIKDMEKYLKGIMPQICIGNLASVFINKIIVAMKDLKNYLLEQLKQLFGASEGFSIKWKTFGWYFNGMMDLLAMLKALSLILKHFADLALQCGVQPCSAPLPDSEIAQIQEAVRHGMLAKETNEPANILPVDQMPTGKTLDDIAGAMKDMTGKDLHVLPSNDGFTVVMPNLYTDAPPQIRDLLTSPEFLNELGSAYTLYVPLDMSFINVVYTYKPVCS